MKRQFQSETAHYATVTSPEESLSVEWDADTGVPSRGLFQDRLWRVSVVGVIRGGCGGVGGQGLLVRTFVA
jgi:hypothetical protein